jgi:hypothetical protein
MANVFSEEFWNEQQRRNQNGAPKYVVCTDKESAEDEFFLEWLEKWGDQLSYLDNTGCSCCINTYDFDAPAEAIAELPAGLVAPYEAEK